MTQETAKVRRATRKEFAAIISPRARQGTRNSKIKGILKISVGARFEPIDL
jgi:hypothetical protein